MGWSGRSAFPGWEAWSELPLLLGFPVSQAGHTAEGGEGVRPSQVLMSFCDGPEGRHMERAKGESRHKRWGHPLKSRSNLPDHLLPG